jgi:hypothetical protein
LYSKTYTEETDYMQPTTTTRSILVYGIIGLALLAAVVLGVQFAKNRSAQVASSGNQPQIAASDQQQPAPSSDQQGGAQEPSTPPPSEPTPEEDQNEGTALGSDNEPAPQPSIRVPATGTEDVILMTLAMSLSGFSAVVYFKSRRRLMTLN